jgi:two-component system KDP operon response regulator KdpE
VSTILLVDDEPTFLRALSTILRAHGFKVEGCATGEEALRSAPGVHPDLVILDLGLPGIDGSEVVCALRAWSQMPVLVLSARASEEEKVAVLDAGADDYVTKPFAMNELLARIRAALRRAAPAGEAAVVKTDHFAVDLASKQVVLGGGEVVRLTPTQWHLVETLVRNQGKLVSQRQLLQEVWGPHHVGQSNYLRVYMAQIRGKLEPIPSRPRYFLTEPGMGYRFVA